MRQTALVFFVSCLGFNFVVGSELQLELPTSHSNSSISGSDNVTQIISSTDASVSGNFENGIHRAMRQIAILDSLSCLPRFLCGLSTRPSAKTGAINDYGYLMKILFERDDDDDLDDDDEEDKTNKKKKETKKPKEKKKKGSTRTGTQDGANEAAETPSKTYSGTKTATPVTPITASKTKQSNQAKKTNKNKSKDSDKNSGSEEEDVSNESAENDNDNSKDDDDDYEDEEEDRPTKERPDYSEFDNIGETDYDDMIRDAIMDSDPEMLPYVLADLKAKSKKKIAASQAAKKAQEEKDKAEDAKLKVEAYTATIPPEILASIKNSNKNSVKSPSVVSNAGAGNKKKNSVKSQLHHSDESTSASLEDEEDEEEQDGEQEEEDSKKDNREDDEVDEDLPVSSVTSSTKKSKPKSKSKTKAKKGNKNRGDNKSKSKGAAATKAGSTSASEETLTLSRHEIPQTYTSYDPHSHYSSSLASSSRRKPVYGNNHGYGGYYSPAGASASHTHSHPSYSSPSHYGAGIGTGAGPGSGNPAGSLMSFGGMSMHHGLPPTLKRKGNIVHKLNKNILDKFGFAFSSSQPQPGSVLESLLPSQIYQSFKSGLTDDDDDLDALYKQYQQAYASGGLETTSGVGAGLRTRTKTGTKAGTRTRTRLSPGYTRSSKQSQEKLQVEYGEATHLFAQSRELESESSARQMLNLRFRRIFQGDDDQFDGETQNFIARKSRQLNVTTDPLEKYRVAVETGQKTKSARQCRFLFSRCPYTSEEVQAMIKNFQNLVIAQKTVGDKEVKLKQKEPADSSSTSTQAKRTKDKTGVSIAKVTGMNMSDISMVQNLPMAENFEIKLKLKPKDEVIEITMGGAPQSLMMNAADFPPNIREALEAWTKNGSKSKPVAKNETLSSTSKSTTVESIFDEDDATETPSNASPNATPDSNTDSSIFGTGTTIESQFFRPPNNSTTTTTIAPDKAFTPSSQSYNMIEGHPIIPIPSSAVYGHGSQSHQYRTTEFTLDPNEGKRRKGNYRHSSTNKKYAGETVTTGKTTDLSGNRVRTRPPTLKSLPTRPVPYKVQRKATLNSNSNPTSTVKSFSSLER